MKKIFLAASGAFAAIPGIGAMAHGLSTPPGYSILFGGVLEASGVLAILLLASSKGRLRRLRSRQVANIVIALAIASFCLLGLYLLLAEFCVVKRPIHGTVYYPLWLSGHVEQMVVRAGGRYAAVDHYGAYPLMKAIQETPHYPFSMVVTTALLLLVYQGVFAAITLAFGILGVRDNKTMIETLDPIDKVSGPAPSL